MFINDRIVSIVMALLIAFVSQFAHAMEKSPTQELEQLEQVVEKFLNQRVSLQGNKLFENPGWFKLRCPQYRMKILNFLKYNNSPEESAKILEAIASLFSDEFTSRDFCISSIDTNGKSEEIITSRIEITMSILAMGLSSLEVEQFCLATKELLFVMQNNVNYRADSLIVDRACKIEDALVIKGISNELTHERYQGNCGSAISGLLLAISNKGFFTSDLFSNITEGDSHTRLSVAIPLIRLLYKHPTVCRYYLYEILEGFTAPSPAMSAAVLEMLNMFTFESEDKTTLQIVADFYKTHFLFVDSDKLKSIVSALALAPELLSGTNRLALKDVMVLINKLAEFGANDIISRYRALLECINNVCNWENLTGAERLEFMVDDLNVALSLESNPTNDVEGNSSDKN